MELFTISLELRQDTFDCPSDSDEVGCSSFSKALVELETGRFCTSSLY